MFFQDSAFHFHQKFQFGAGGFDSLLTDTRELRGTKYAQFAQSLFKVSDIDREKLLSELEKHAITSIKLSHSLDTTKIEVSMHENTLFLSSILEVIKIQDILKLTIALGAKKHESLIAFDGECFPLASLPLPLLSSHILTSFRRKAIADILTTENKEEADIRDAYFSKRFFLDFQNNGCAASSQLIISEKLEAALKRDGGDIQEKLEAAQKVFWDEYTVPARMVEYTQRFIANLPHEVANSIREKMYLLYEEIKWKKKDDLLSFSRNEEVLREVFNLYTKAVETEDGEQRDTLMREIQKTEVENGLIPLVDIRKKKDAIRAISEALEGEDAYNMWQEKNATACFKRAIWDGSKNMPTSYGALVLLFVAKVTRFTDSLATSSLYNTSPEHQFIRAVSQESFEECLGSIENADLLKKIVEVYPMGFKAASAQLQADPKVCFEIAEILIKTGIFSRYMPDDAIQSALSYIDLSQDEGKVDSRFLSFFKEISSNQKVKDIFVKKMPEKLRECLLKSKDLQLISEVRQWCETEEVAATYMDDQVIDTAIEVTDWSNPENATAITDLKEYFRSDNFARSKALIERLCTSDEEIPRSILDNLKEIGFTLGHVPEGAFEQVFSHFVTTTDHAITRAIKKALPKENLQELIQTKLHESIGTNYDYQSEIDSLPQGVTEWNTDFFNSDAFCTAYTECMCESDKPTYYFYLAPLEQLLKFENARVNLLYSFLEKCGAQDPKQAPLTRKKLLQLLAYPSLAATFMGLIEDSSSHSSRYEKRHSDKRKSLSLDDNLKDKFYQAMPTLLEALCSEEIDAISPLRKCIELAFGRGVDYFANNIKAINRRAVHSLLDELNRDNISFENEHNATLTFKKIDTMLQTDENCEAVKVWLSEKNDLNSVHMRLVNFSVLAPTFMESIAQLDNPRRMRLFVEHAASNPSWCSEESILQFRFDQVKIKDLKMAAITRLDTFYIEGEDVPELSLLQLFSKSILTDTSLSENFSIDQKGLCSLMALVRSIIVFEPPSERLKCVLKSIISCDQNKISLEDVLSSIIFVNKKNPYDFFHQDYLENECLKDKGRCLHYVANAIVRKKVSSQDHSSSFLEHEKVAIEVIRHSYNLETDPFAILPDKIWDTIINNEEIKKHISFLLRKNSTRVLQAIQKTDNNAILGGVFYAWLCDDAITIDQQEELAKAGEAFCQLSECDRTFYEEQYNNQRWSPKNQKMVVLFRDILPQSKVMQNYFVENWSKSRNQCALIANIQMILRVWQISSASIEEMVNAFPMEGYPNSPPRILFREIFFTMVERAPQVLVTLDAKRVAFFYTSGLYERGFKHVKEDDEREKLLSKWLSTPHFIEECMSIGGSHTDENSVFNVFFSMWFSKKLESIENLDQIIVSVFRSIFSEIVYHEKDLFIIKYTNEDVLDTIFQKVVPVLDSGQLRLLFVSIGFEKIQSFNLSRQFSIFNSNVLRNLQTGSHFSGYKSDFEKKIESILEQFPAWLEKMVREDRTVLETVDGEFLKRIFEDPSHRRSAIREKLSNTLLELLQFDTSDEGKNIFKKWLEHYPDAMELALRDNPTWKEKVLQFLEANPLSGELQSRFLRLIDKSEALPDANARTRTLESVTARPDMDEPLDDFSGYNASADTSYQAARATVDTRNPGFSDAMEDIGPFYTTNPSQRHRENEKPKKSFLQRCKKWFVTLFQRLFAFLRSLRRSAN